MWTDARALAYFGLASTLSAVFLYGGMWVSSRRDVSRRKGEVALKENFERELAATTWGLPLIFPSKGWEVRELAFSWLRCYHLTAGRLRDQFMEASRAQELNAHMRRYRESHDPDLRYVAWALAAACEPPQWLAAQLPRLPWPTGREVALALAPHEDARTALGAVSWAIEKRAPTADLSTLVSLCKYAKQEPLEKFLLNREAKAASRLLQAWGSGHPDSGRAIALRILRQPDNEGWLLCAALRLLQGPTDVALARLYLHDRRWSVRLAAIKAMGKHGFRSDIEALLPHVLSDNFWIRQRAQRYLGPLDDFSARDLS